MASSSQDLQQKLEDLVICPICLDSFSDPRVLPCHHTLCLGCLEGVLGTSSQMECPVCKQKIQVTNGVSDFPTDFKANSVLEVIKYWKAKAGQGNGTTPREQTGQEQIRNVPSSLGSSHADLQATVADNHHDNPHCPVCAGAPTDPHCLNCGHLLCWKCVEFLLPVGGSSVNCLTCDCDTVIVEESSSTPRSSSTTDEGNQSGLHDDTQMLQMISLLDLDVAEVLANLEPPNIQSPGPVPLAEEEIPAAALSCSLCQDDGITSPEHLNCGHVLCGGCAAFLAPVLGSSLHCPVCQMET